MEKNKILELLEKIKNAKAGKSTLPGNAYFLDKDEVVCCERELGDSRYPYAEDGLVVWLHSNGLIDACESNFTIFRTSVSGEESPVLFFGGLPIGDKYFPVSVTGGSKQTFEENIERYTVFTLKCAYCITECENVIFALRLHVDREKHIRFAFTAVNKTDKEQKVYLASYVETMLRYGATEDFWARMYKFAYHFEDGNFLLKSQYNGPDMLTVNRKVSGNVTESWYTTSKDVFVGAAGRIMANAKSLVDGKFSKVVGATNTASLPCAAEIIHVSLEPYGTATLDYDMAVCRDMEIAEALLARDIDNEKIDAELKALTEAEKCDFDNLKINFEGWKSDKCDSDTFNKFFRCIQKQTSFCAHGKNYAGEYLGVRDVFQQLEGALVWQPRLSREKIVLALNFILETGRPPRMFSIPHDPTDPDVWIPLDLEKYIDQGVWIISTIYTYLAYTGDFGILDEKCDYLTAPDEAWVSGRKTGERTTVLEHLIRICDFLISNMDTEYTNCLKVLFGDWNDAVDGLGKTDDEGKEFGTGVTVMATLQFYQNLAEMQEILAKVGGYDELRAKYADLSEKIAEGLEKYAVAEKDGHRRVIHGWGDKVSYQVGSYCDPDGESRVSLTPNAFWAITRFIDRDVSLKESIMESFEALDSKYGLKTFDKAFPKGCPGVGRIHKIVPGTYENSCAYAHGSLFGTMALFEMGESEKAWEQIEKTMVITHGNATRTSFIMPNSYCENAEYNMDGESMGDWHTGSGAVLAKETIRYGFGIYPRLDGVRIQAPAYFPAAKGEITVPVKGVNITLRFEDKNQGKRTVTISGATYTESFDSLMNIPVFFIKNEDIKGDITVEITD